MNSPLSFVGKCLTVLVGAGLSWATVTNPVIDQAAAHLCGLDGSCEPACAVHAPGTSFAVSVEPAHGLVNAGTNAENGVGEPNLAQGLHLMPQHRNSQSKRASSMLSAAGARPEVDAASTKTRIQEISLQLKQLGASYLLLEKLPWEDGTRYRARCDLAARERPTKCCFEATRETPLGAMEDVLRAVKISSRSTEVGAPI